MSAHTSEDQLYQELKAELANAKRELGSRQPLNGGDWDHLRYLAAAFKALPHHDTPFPQRALVQVTCAYAADMLMHRRADRADRDKEMLAMLSSLEEGAERLYDSLRLTLYTYLALVAALAEDHLAAANWAAKTDSYMKHAPSMPVKACIWLMRGQVEHQSKRRKALLRALKLFKQLDNRNRDLLLEYRARVALYELYRALGKPIHHWWHSRRAEGLNDKLLLQRQLDQAEISEAAREPLPMPHLQLLDLR